MRTLQAEAENYKAQQRIAWIRKSKKERELITRETLERLEKEYGSNLS